jgi:hypothetical protein
MRSGPGAQAWLFGFLFCLVLRLQSHLLINPESLLGRPGTDVTRVGGVLNVRIGIAYNRAPAEMTKMLPTLQNDPPIEWLSLDGENDASGAASTVSD